MCTHVNDLGVILDVKLTFRDHIDSCVNKANRMLGLLMRSMQVSSCMTMRGFDYRPVLCAYYAHVRSVVEYGSVIWGGAVASHLARLERLQHRFLMWLGAKTPGQCSMDYASLTEHFHCASIRARFAQADVMFVRSVFSGRIDCAHLVSAFALLAPGRRSRQTGLFSVPFGRVNTVKNSYKMRVPKLVNDFLSKKPAEDFFQPSRFFMSNLRDYVVSLGSFMM